MGDEGRDLHNSRRRGMNKGITELLAAEPAVEASRRPDAAVGCSG
jgi:hypothetical protein